MSGLRVALLRGLYRVAWRGVQLRSMLGHRGNGVKCLLTHDGKVLMVRHTYGRRDVWYLPGGGVHRGEPPLDAAAREMEEELGLRELRFRTLARFETRLERIDVRLTCAHAEVTDPTAVSPDPVEIADVGWFVPERLPTRMGLEERRLIGLLGTESGSPAPPQEDGPPGHV
ncbi:MAG TPA: NUDIX hydrolase [Solirubrobacteraceae bacterium]|nr:NUDIX hydrolase [Solirubrobacteraceae bacterium]